jgi:hypothetical protein
MNRIPENIRQFVHSSIDSVEQLEVLALLHDNPEKEWTIQALSQELRSTESSVDKRLRDLVDRRVLEPIENSPFFYRPKSPALDELVSELVRYYRLFPFRIMDMIFSRPVNTMQSFADAFRFKKEDS